MEESFTIIKKRTLEKQRANLIEEYQAVTDQIDSVHDPSSRTRLKRQAQKIEKEIHDLEAELQSLAVALVHDDEPANLTAVAQRADELAKPESVVAEENVSQPTAVPEPADDSPEPELIRDDRPDESAETEPATTQENTPDLPALSQPPGIFEVATGFVKQWLWAQFLLWTLVSALSFTSDLGGVLDLTLPTRLLVLGLLVFVGGVVILGISLLPAYRARYHVWDRRLSAALWLIISAAILGLWQTEIGKPISEVVVTTPTPTATITPAVTSSITTTVVSSMLTTTITETATPPVCSAPHPTLSGSSIGGNLSVTYISIPVMSDCLEIKEQLSKFQVSWKDVPVDTELWLLVYSPLTQLYFPHYCTRIQNPTGGQECRVTLLKEEPYDIVFVLADATAHGVLQANSSLPPSGIPGGLAEKFAIQVFRTE